jgi:hypothetical protein
LEALAGVVKTSQVRVASGDDDRVYSSLEEVPPDVRRAIRRALNGPYADTFVIADEGGRRRIFEAIRGLPPHLQKRVMSAIQFTEPPKPFLSPRVRLALGAGALVLAAAVIALLWSW